MFTLDLLVVLVLPPLFLCLLLRALNWLVNKMEDLDDEDNDKEDEVNDLI